MQNRQSLNRMLQSAAAQHDEQETEQDRLQAQAREEKVPVL
jgi:translocation and assembly module TamA